MKVRTNKKNELVAEDGTKLGEHIKGSKYVRGFCIYCNEPMRVPIKNLLTCVCTQCEPPARTVVVKEEISTIGGVLGKLKEQYGDYFTGQETINRNLDF